MRVSTFFTLLAVSVAGVSAATTSVAPPLPTTNGTAPVGGGPGPGSIGGPGPAKVNTTSSAGNATGSSTTSSKTSGTGTSAPASTSSKSAAGALSLNAETLMGLMAVPVALHFGL